MTTASFNRQFSDGQISLILPAPAKLNLMLHIVGRRTDGYHLLQSQFQFLDYCDSLHFQLNDSQQIKLVSSIADLPTEDNLVVKAIRKLLAFKNIELPSGVDIRLDKKIPMGGGLGGGSSNAATTLLALNHLWSLGLSIDQLADIGLSLGADVPVFVHGFAAWAEGVGERLTPIELKERWFLVITPACHISTQEIFCHPELTRDTEIMTITRALDQGGHNDCEAIARSLYKEVDEAIIWLSRFAPAQMTGTGACVFAGFDDVDQANAVYHQLPNHWHGFVAQGKNTSPLHKTLAEITLFSAP